MLLEELTSELKNEKDSGQPIIDEQHSPTTRSVRVNVIWDQWSGVSDEDRTAIILNAYEAVEGKEFRDRIALAVGLTVPEAAASGLLPFEVIAALRTSDNITLQQCRAAMVAEGASVLVDAEKPMLRFATLEEAQACIRRLGEKLPGSQPVWIVSRNVADISGSGQ
jgi:hypothetical protein